MKLAAGLGAVAAVALAAGAGLAQSGKAPAVPVLAQPDASMTPAPTAVRPAPAKPVNEKAVLELRALDKITGRSKVLYAPLNQSVKYATLTITAKSCYSTPPSETPETSAFLQIDDRRSDQAARRVFSGWMYASSPGLNGMQHPLYDVWAIKCMTNAPAKAPTATAVVPVSPNAGADEGLPALPEDAGQ
jgi:hypothetical protein